MKPRRLAVFFKRSGLNRARRPGFTNRLLAERRAGRGKFAARFDRPAVAGVCLLALTLALTLGVALASAAAPTVTVGPVSSVSFVSAHVSGTVDPQDQETFYYFQYSTDESNWNFATVQGPIAAGSGVQNVSDEITGLQPGTHYFVRLVAESQDGQAISDPPNPSFTTDPVAAPTVSIDPVTSFTGTTAHFSGKVNPNGTDPAFDAAWHFECTPSCPGLQGGQVIADGVEHAVSEDATGLQPNTNYEVSLVASSLGGQNNAGPEIFKTNPVAPEVQTLYAGSVSTDAATLAATVNPKNSPVTYQFEWGTTDSYGNIAPLAPTALGSSDNSFHVVTTPISGLSQGTTYHFRVLATNTDTSELTEGADHTFTTFAPAGPPTPSPNSVPGPPGANSANRHYELVSPLDTSGVQVMFPHSIFSQSIGGTVERQPVASPDGERVLFRTSAPLPGFDSSVNNDHYIAHRTPTGWVTEYVGVPGHLVPTPTQFQYYTEDLLRTFIQLKQPATLDPDDPGDGSSLYARNADGSFTWILRNSFGIDAGTSADAVIAGSSRDGSTPVFYSKNPLEPEAGTTQFALYVPAGDHAELVSILPDNVTPVGGLARGWVSDDGERVAFQTGVPQESGRIFIRERDVQETVEVSAPQGGAGISQGHVAGVSDDLTVVYFTSDQQLTADDTDSSVDLYRFDLNTQTQSGTLTRVSVADAAAPDSGNGDGCNSDFGTPACDVSPVLTSRDGSSAYFISPERLQIGAVAGKPNLYLARGATIEFLGTLAAEDLPLAEISISSQNPGARPVRASADGSEFVFDSRAQMTSYANAGVLEVYAFDAETGQIVCVSCAQTPSLGPNRPSSLRFTATGSIPAIDYTEGLFAGRNLTADATKVFFNSRERLVADDHNGSADAYEYNLTTGQISLVSSGAGGPSLYVDNSADGRDVFISTQDALVPQDLNGSTLRIYDARSDGGFPVELHAPCVSDECQGPPSSLPSEQSTASAAFTGPGNSKAKRHHKRRHKHRHHNKKHQTRNTHRTPSTLHPGAVR